MKRFDKRLQRQLKQEAPQISEKAESAFDETMAKIKSGQLKRKFSISIYAVWVTAAVFLIFLNFSVKFLDRKNWSAIESAVCSSEKESEGIKKAAEEPQIEEIESIRVGMIDYRNPEIRQYTDMIFTQYKKDKKDNQKTPAIDSKIITNTERWFTLRLTVQGEREGTLVYHYYHIDKKSCNIVQLSDLFAEGFDYINIFSDEIKRQMQTEMSNDTNKTYYIDFDRYTEGSFYKIDKNQNFYFNQSGNLVIVFDREEVAPEDMGCPHFVIDKELYELALK